jgi:hypothetical protein
MQYTDWSKIGAALRDSAIGARLGPDGGYGVASVDAYGAPSILSAYSFLLYNPDLFIPADEGTDWPIDMPIHPPAALVAAYYRITVKHAELWLNAQIAEAA